MLNLKCSIPDCNRDGSWASWSLGLVHNDFAVPLVLCDFHYEQLLKVLHCSIAKRVFFPTRLLLCSRSGCIAEATRLFNVYHLEDLNYPAVLCLSHYDFYTRALSYD